MIISKLTLTIKPSGNGQKFEITHMHKIIKQCCKDKRLRSKMFCRLDYSNAINKFPRSNQSYIEQCQMLLIDSKKFKINGFEMDLIKNILLIQVE